MSNAIDAYLATLRKDQRTVLEALRKQIHAAAPGAVECISYGMPAFRVGGALIAGFAARDVYFTYAPTSGNVVEALGDDLAGYKTSKGAVRFTAEKPLTPALVRKLIAARVAEVVGR